MEHIEHLTRYTAHFVEELVRSGVTDVVISPGSRSTPLAMTMVEHSSLKAWVIIDERSAAFFALGLAKATERPVAIVCTSGTAAANYFPAVVEAHYSRVPLIVLTADRPHELRDVGAPQAIEQIKLYGDYVKWFQEMALPDASSKMLAYIRSKASRAVSIATHGNPGPVHLNFPFREPLVPNFSLDNVWSCATENNNRKPLTNSPFAPVHNGKKRLSEQQLTVLIEKLKSHKRGLIVCGPQVSGDVAAAIVRLADAWHLPVLADPLSQVRSGQHNKACIIESYDAFLRSETIREQLRPDFIIRFGAMPVSKPYLFFVQTHRDALQFVVEPDGDYREPAGNASDFIFSDPVDLCHDLIDKNPHMPFSTSWLKKWQTINRLAKHHIQTRTNASLTEGEAVRTLMDVIPDKSRLYVGNSMAVRDLDTFFLNTEKEINVLANRGANGIDGMVSSGLGAAASGKQTTLLLGDLSFFHDMNGLLAAKQYEIDLTILLINNDGGGIFSFLPQRDEKHFETLFGTPLGIDFQHAVHMYGGVYTLATNDTELRGALQGSYNEKGLDVIEVRTEREENADWHKALWNDIVTDILANGM
ncbi:MAG TPA: 2-succinyl-5-enolpyruvyl-6-hydroxy-3-cyclohexene-1-carboxylic-acid synthase [Bacillota bacterium]|nr:2-succinyl-5-enolpyruvyl-6-hydroxy-3-cyclohexene-1-carboxylic-acid synthase [Bacillota bacterium]